MKGKTKDKKFVLWLTGLPNAGKTTIGDEIYNILKSKGLPVKRLDGDVVREKINKSLSFSKQDRDKNLRIVADLAESFNNQGYIVIASFISPYRKQRRKIRKKIKNYIEIFVNASLKVCEKRDTKGLYKKARLGQIKNFTGISDPYESPVNSELELKTDKEQIKESVNRVMDYLIANKHLKQNFK